MNLKDLEKNPFSGLLGTVWIQQTKKGKKFYLFLFFIYIYSFTEKLFMKLHTLFLTISAPPTDKHSETIWQTNYLSCKNYKKKLETVNKVIWKKKTKNLSVMCVMSVYMKWKNGSTTIREISVPAIPKAANTHGT